MSAHLELARARDHLSTPRGALQDLGLNLQRASGGTWHAEAGDLWFLGDSGAEQMEVVVEVRLSAEAVDDRDDASEELRDGRDEACIINDVCALL